MAKLIKISKLYNDLGVTKQTILNWKKAGKIELIKLPGGHNFVSEETYNLLLNIKNKSNKDENQE